MVSNIARRVGNLETGNGKLSIGDLLDMSADPKVDFDHRETWPVAYRGRDLDPATMRSLDGMDPAVDELTTEEVAARARAVLGGVVFEHVEKSPL